MKAQVWFRLGHNRVHAALRHVRAQEHACRAAAKAEVELRGDNMYAASLRGKAHAYRECADVLEALDKNRRLPKKR